MNKSKDKVSLNPNEKWQQDFLDYEENIEWRILSEKFALAVMRLLRHQKKNQIWLANELDKSPQYISRLIKGKENLSLKSMASIQAIFNTEIVSIKNIDLAIRHRDSRFYISNNNQDHMILFEPIKSESADFIPSNIVNYIKVERVNESIEVEYQLIEDYCKI